MLDEGAHDGDWENIQILVDKQFQKVLEVKFFQHGGHYSVLAPFTDLPHPVKFTANGAHVIVYVGKMSHGSYHFGGGRGGYFYFDDYRNPVNGPWPATKVISMAFPPDSDYDWVADDASDRDWKWGEISNRPGRHPADCLEHMTVSCADEACNFKLADACASMDLFSRYTKGLFTGCEDGNAKAIFEKVSDALKPIVADAEKYLVDKPKEWIDAVGDLIVNDVGGFFTGDVADFFGDVGDWFEGDFTDFFTDDIPDFFNDLFGR